MLHVAQPPVSRSGRGDVDRCGVRNRFELSEELIDAARLTSERLLVVDEAQWLNRECIEYLRHLHDHPRHELRAAVGWW